MGRRSVSWRARRPLVMSGIRRRAPRGLMLATDWAGASILRYQSNWSCGLHHFRPVRHRRRLSQPPINKALRLDKGTARPRARCYGKPPAHGSLDAVVGGNEKRGIFPAEHAHCRTMGQTDDFTDPAMAWESLDIIEIAPRSWRISYAAIAFPRIRDSAKGGLPRWRNRDDGKPQMSRCSSSVLTVKVCGFVDDGRDIWFADRS